MDNEHIIQIIKKLNIFVLSTTQNNLKNKQFAATIYDGGTLIYTAFGETYDESLANATAWVHDNFEVPKDLSTLGYIGKLVKQVKDNDN